MASQKKRRRERKQERPSGLAVSRPQAVRILHISTRSFDRLEAEGVITPAVPRRGTRGAVYDAVAVVGAYLAHRSRVPAGTDRDRYFRLQGDKLELEIRVRTGELVSAAEIEERWGEIVVSVRERVYAIPDVLLQRGVPAEHQTLIREVVDDALCDLAGAPRRTVSPADRAALRRACRAVYPTTQASFHSMAYRAIDSLPAAVRERLGSAALTIALDVFYELPPRYLDDDGDAAVQEAIRSCQ